MKNATSGECGLTPTVREAIEWAQAEAGYEVELKDLISHMRYARLVRIRRLAAWRMRTRYRLSFPRIAAVFKRDHATIMHHIELENEALGLPKDYPQGYWRAEREAALTDNIDIIADRLANGGTIDALAYEFRLPTHRLKLELKEFYRRAADKSSVSRADNQRTDRIVAEPVGASM